MRNEEDVEPDVLFQQVEVGQVIAYAADQEKWPTLGLVRAKYPAENPELANDDKDGNAVIVTTLTCKKWTGKWTHQREEARIPQSALVMVNIELTPTQILKKTNQGQLVRAYEGWHFI